MNAERLAIGQATLVNRAVSQELPPGKVARMKFRFKRMLFVTSLYFRLVGTDKPPTEDELDVVNERFKLAHSPRALLFPAAVAVLLWKGLDLTTILEQYHQNQITIQQLSKELLSCVPAWLQYGDGNLLQQDIRAVVDSVGFVG